MYDIKRYVVGFMFDPKMERVVFIKKTHGPESVIGKWNGVGGQIEDGEGPKDAMVREFKEETGLDTVKVMWEDVMDLEGPDFLICFYVTWNVRIDQVRTMTDETVEIVHTNLIGRGYYEFAPSVQWLLWFLMDKSTYNYIGRLLFCST